MDRVIALRRRQNLKSGINQLPPEIIILIIKHVIKIRAAKDYFTHPVFRFSSRWRDLALGTPSLWTEIWHPSPEITRELLRRSEGNLLDILFPFPHALELVIPHKARWRTFHYSSSKDFSDWLSSEGVPELVDLNLHLQNAPSVFPFGGVMPKLRKLESNHLIPLDEDTKGRLEEVEFTHGLSPEELMDWLPSRNNLRRLKIHSDWRYGIIRPALVSHFTNLKHLDLQGAMATAFLPIIPLIPSSPTFQLRLRNIGDAQTIIDTAFRPSANPLFHDAPLLISLCTSLKVTMPFSGRYGCICVSDSIRGYLEIPFYSPEERHNILIQETFDALGNVSLPPLQFLDLEAPVSLASIINLLDAVPTVKSLTIRGLDVFVALLERLSTATPSVLLPNMTDLRLLQTYNSDSVQSPNNIGRTSVAAATLGCLKSRTRLPCFTLKSLSMKVFEDEEIAVEELRSYTEVLYLG